MQLLRTAIFLSSLAFTFYSPHAKASNTYEFDQINVYGSLINSVEEDDVFVYSYELLATIDVTNDNRRAFRNVLPTGTAIRITAAILANYGNIVYTQETYKLEPGKTYGLFPIVKGNANIDAFNHMHFKGVLSRLKNHFIP